MEHLSNHKQLDGPFDAPEITRQATLTHILMLQVYNTVGSKTVAMFEGFGLSAMQRLI